MKRVAVNDADVDDDVDGDRHDVVSTLTVTILVLNFAD